MKEVQKEFVVELEPVIESQKYAIALIEENIKWMKIHGSEIQNWMQAQVREEKVGS